MGGRLVAGRTASDRLAHRGLGAKSLSVVRAPDGGALVMGSVRESPAASASKSRAMSPYSCSGATGSDVSLAVPAVATAIKRSLCQTDHIAARKNSECLAETR